MNGATERPAAPGVMDAACSSHLRCDWCGHWGPPVHVHGHTQCARCKTNIEPCCAGAPIYAPEDEDDAP
jgi:hypothetical protein